MLTYHTLNPDLLICPLYGETKQSWLVANLHLLELSCEQSIIFSFEKLTTSVILPFALLAAARPDAALVDAGFDVVCFGSAFFLVGAFLAAVVELYNESSRVTECF